MPRRVKRLEQDGDGAFTLVDDRIAWRNTPFARLATGDTVLTPRIEVLHSDFLDGPARQRLRKRGAVWLPRHIRAQLRPLFKVSEAEVTPAGRGLLFQLVHAHRTLHRRHSAAPPSARPHPDRQTLTTHATT